MFKIKILPSALLLFIGLFLSEHKETSILLLLCAIIHELGHILLAAILKIRIKELRISISGAKIIPYSCIHSYIDEILLCLGGPLANIITFALMLPSFKIPDSANIMALDTHSYIALLSILISAINLLPIKNLDGGRILFCLLSLFFGEKAGYIAIRISTFTFSLILWMFSVYLLILSHGGISFFTFSLCMMIKIFEE